MINSLGLLSLDELGEHFAELPEEEHWYYERTASGQRQPTDRDLWYEREKIAIPPAQGHCDNNDCEYCTNPRDLFSPACQDSPDGQPVKPKKKKRWWNPFSWF